MSGLVDGAEYLVAELRAAGVEADTDPRNLSLPGVLVSFDQISDLLDAETATYRLLAIVPDNGNPLAALDQLRTTIKPFADGVARAATVVLANHNPAPLPALELSATVHLTKE